MPIAIRCLFLIDLALAALYLTDTAIGHRFWTFARLFDLDGEGNVPTWYSASQFLILAALLAAFACTRPGRRYGVSLPLLGLSAVALVMSVDEVAQIHEWIGKQLDAVLTGGTRKGTIVSKTGVWMLFIAPLLVGVVALLAPELRTWLSGRQPIVRLYVIGFVVYVASAFGLELLSNATASGSLAATLQITCEELGEMAGITLLVWASLELLTSHGVQISVVHHTARK